MDYEFERPPRWDPARPERPAIVYLDQWCWDQLVRDRAGDLDDTPDAGIYERLKELAKCGQAVFPLSQAHYVENSTRTNVDARWDTAVVMAELGGFVTMTTAGLVDWDAEVAVAAYFGLDPPPDPNPFGWGFRYCMTGVEGTAHIVDRVANARAADLPMTPRLAEELARLDEEVGYRFELAILGGREPRLEEVGALEPSEPFVDTLAPLFSAQQDDFAATLNDHDRTPVKVRNWLNFLAWRDSMQYIELASARLGVDPFGIMNEIAEAGSVGDATLLDRFVALMPIQRTFTELRIAAHLKSNFNFGASDRFDFLAAATAMPFADYIVLDRRTFNLLNDTEPSPAHTARPMRRLRDLCAALGDRFAD